MFVPLVETALAFAAVMLATSLFVSAIVQLIANALQLRGHTLQQLLEQLWQSFREHFGAGAGADDPGAQKFAVQVLTHPALHARDNTQRYPAASDKSKLALKVDYLHPADLMSLVRGMSSKDGDAVAAGTKLPESWGTGTWATVGNFESYVKRWFGTIEATHSQDFKQQMRRLTLGVSFAVVVLFCLDGIQLINTLWHDRTAAEALTKQVDTLQQTAARLGVAAAPAGTLDSSSAAVASDTTSKALVLELQKTATILDDAGAGIGWQNARITRRWCAYRGYCQDPPVSGGRLLADFFLFLFGLAFSCVMLALGAPFWVTTLSSLIRLQNEVQRVKQQPPPPGIGSQTLP